MSKPPPGYRRLFSSDLLVPVGVPERHPDPLGGAPAPGPVPFVDRFSKPEPPKPPMPKDAVAERLYRRRAARLNNAPPRPAKASDMVGQDEAVAQVESLLSSSSPPHILLVGPQEPSETDRRSACLSIGRAVNFRYKALKRALSTKMLERLVRERTGRDADSWNVLLYADVVRPVMLAEITELRNRIEHEWESPPSATDCRKYSEFAYYFLGSTQPLLRRCAELEMSLEIGAGDTRHLMHLTVKPSGAWKGSVRGQFVSLDAISAARSTAANDGIVLCQPKCHRFDYATGGPQFTISGSWSPRPEVVADFLLPMLVDVVGFGG